MKCSPDLHNVHKKEMTYMANSTLSPSSKILCFSVLFRVTIALLHSSLPKLFHSSIKSAMMIMSDLLLAHSSRQGPFCLRVGTSQGAHPLWTNSLGLVGTDTPAGRTTGVRKNRRRYLPSFGGKVEKRLALTQQGTSYVLSCSSPNIPWLVIDGCQLLCLFINESSNYK